MPRGVIVLYRHQNRQHRQEEVWKQHALCLLLHKAFERIAVFEDVVEEVAADEYEEVCATKDDVSDDLLGCGVDYPPGAADAMAGDNAHDRNCTKGFETRKKFTLWSFLSRCFIAPARHKITG